MTDGPLPDFACLARHGDAPALVRTGQPDISHAALDARARAFARRLGPGRRLVAIEAAATVEAVAAWLGVVIGGHAAVLLPPDDAAARDDIARRFQPDATFARVAGRWRLTLDPRPKPALHPDLALVLMTSGSTGQGKGVRLSRAALTANALSIARYLGLGAGDRAGLVLPLQYSYGLSVLHTHLAVGGSVWLAEGGLMAPGFVDDLRAARVTTLSTVPHGYELLERRGFRAASLPDLRQMTVAGGALPVALIRTYAAHLAARGGAFFAMYGQTEATARIAFVPPARALDLPLSQAGCIGQAIPGGHLSLQGPDGRALTTPGVEGELVYRGPNVMMGYAAGRAELARGAEVQALATGDLAVQGADGMYRITGRKRRLSKIAGLRIGHDAVEAALAAAGVTAAVTGDDSRLRVAFTGDAPAAGIAAKVASLAGLTPRHVEAFALPALPRLPSGKVDYPALAAHGPARAAAPGIVEAFRDSFHPVPVSEAQSFRALGGDSLRHVELAMALEQALGHLPDRWEDRPVGDLARLVPLAEARPGLGTDLVVRAAAILAVVVTHETLWPVYGGAAAMVVLIGMVWARFQHAALAEGRAGHLFRPLWRVLLPYYAILAGFSLAWGQVPWGSVFLVSNFGIGSVTEHTRMPYLYWFVEAYAQMTLLLAALTLAGPVRRLIGQRPFAFGLWFLAGATGLRLVGPAVMGLGGGALFTVPWVLYLAALGWLIATADTRRRRLLVLGLAAVILPLVAYLGGNWYGAWLKYLSILGVVALLLFVPRLTLPRGLARAVLAVGSASYLIYLTHRLLPDVAMLPLRALLPDWAFSGLAIGGAVLAGVALTAAQRRLSHLWRTMGRDRRPVLADL